ncbi:MAG: ECF-type sigma factor, partial [Gemmatimonadota bacterium]|nr:ECF-type sigma factor [Gemmatimonadota bacterium]
RMVALDEALSRLSEQDPRLAEVVELRFFGGLSVEETAKTLGISARTVKRDWRLARAFLQGHLG